MICIKNMTLFGEMKKIASSGNRTRVYRVAGGNYTTKPNLPPKGGAMLFIRNLLVLIQGGYGIFYCIAQMQHGIILSTGTLKKLSFNLSSPLLPGCCPCPRPHER